MSVLEKDGFQHFKENKEKSLMYLLYLRATRCGTTANKLTTFTPPLLNTSRTRNKTFYFCNLSITGKNFTKNGIFKN